jgi:hypothetical protein
MTYNEEEIAKMKMAILIDWERGWYGLGWRGAIARWLLQAVLNAEAVKLAAQKDALWKELLD